METLKKLETIELRGKEVSQAIRELLKQKFPKTKFSVKYESYAGGDAIRVRYHFGPTEKEVEKYVNGYQMGSFNGMEDIYEYHGEKVVYTAKGKKNLKGGVKYVTVSRQYPEDFIYKLGEQVSGMLDACYPHFVSPDDIYVIARKMAYKTSFPSDRISNIKPFDLRPTGSVKAEDLFGLKFTCEYAEKEEKLKKEKAEQPKELELTEYSEYSIAVFGPTWQYSEQLKAIGGRYNRFLTHPKTGKNLPGWIFKKNQKETVRQTLRLP